jgi:hypothetical protein
LDVLLDPKSTPPLTRRPDRDPNRSGGWLIYCGDVRVGHIGKQSGVPLHGDQWGWSCGFYPAAIRASRPAVGR